VQPWRQLTIGKVTCIPELDRPKVIKPFVRLATKKARGTGLGLAIVTRLMNLHQGSRVAV
jgi:signal transduction histidine kinase